MMTNTRKVNNKVWRKKARGKVSEWTWKSRVQWTRFLWSLSREGVGRAEIIRAVDVVSRKDLWKNRVKKRVNANIKLLDRFIAWRRDLFVEGEVARE